MASSEITKLHLKPSTGLLKRISVSLIWDDVPLKLRKSQPTNHAGKAVLEDIKSIPSIIRHLHRTLTDSKHDDATGRDGEFEQRDLDLACYIFDEDKNPVRLVDPSPEKQFDPSGTVYHSGDEQTGAGVYDDENILIEISKLPISHQHFFFVCLADTKLSLGECGTFHMHIADSVNETNFVSATVPPQDSGDHTAYLFAHLWRDGEVWYAEKLGEFGSYDTDWWTDLKAKI